LSRAVLRGSVPPTLLFDGPPGVGKWRVAQAVAAVVNCLVPVTDAGAAGSHEAPVVDACGTCKACDRVARGVHVDVIALEPDEKGSIKIDPVRAVLERCNFRPFEGKRRVVLIRDAETLEPQA